VVVSCRGLSPCFTIVPGWVYENEHLEGDGATIFRQACIAGLEGIEYRIRSKAASPL
jgi:hypothetical protein